MGLRLQKVIADAGLASRREAEGWIQAGRVAVNGQTVTQLGTKVDPSHDEVAVDGRKISPKDPKEKGVKVYYLFYKPKNIMTTRKDPQGRPTVYDYLKGIPERVFPVGRLDFDSEGLLLMTNDGELAHRMMHPRSKVPKVYQVQVSRLPAPEEVTRLKAGIELEEGVARIQSIRPVHAREGGDWLELVLEEGKRRQIRRMLKGIGIQVLRLCRTAIGPFRLGPLRPGEWRPVPPEDLPKLRDR